MLGSRNWRGRGRSTATGWRRRSTSSSWTGRRRLSRRGLLSEGVLLYRNLTSLMFIFFMLFQLYGKMGRLVWDEFCTETVQPPYFQNRIIMFCLLISTLIYQWEIYIFPGSVCLFCCSQICGLILGKYKSLTGTWMWKLRLRPRNSRKGIHKWDFCCSVGLGYQRTGKVESSQSLRSLMIIWALGKVPVAF